MPMEKGVKTPGLHKTRKRLALSQRELADKAQVARQTVIRGERGEPIRYVAVRKIAEALGVSVTELTDEPALSNSGVSE
jgi:transcriptional regulator with XRE-family HTH domain